MDLSQSVLSFASPLIIAKPDVSSENLDCPTYSHHVNLRFRRDGYDGFGLICWDDIVARVEYGGVRVDLSGGDRYLTNQRVRLVLRQGVGKDVRIWWNLHRAIINKILNLMSKTIALVSVMARHLMEGTKEIRVVTGR